MAILVPTIVKLLFSKKFSLDSMEMPDEVMTPNRARVAPPRTAFGTTVITADTLGNMPRRSIITPAVAITERLFIFVRSIRLTFSLNMVEGTELKAPVITCETACALMPLILVALSVCVQAISSKTEKTPMH